MNINDFPQGTQVSRLYSPEWFDLVDNKLPVNFSILPFNCTKVAQSTDSRLSYFYFVYLPWERVDFSNVKSIFSTYQESGCFFLVIDDVVLSFPEAETLDLQSLVLMTQMQTDGTMSAPQFNVTVKDLNKIKYLNNLFSTGTYSTIVADKIIIEGDSKELTTLTNTFYSFNRYKELHFNIDCSNVTNLAPFYYQIHDETTYFSGFPNLKRSLNSSYSLDRFPNLTLESCISILENLYDFTGNGETPTSNQGVLKVHANFLTTVGDDITIGTNKGWKISS